MSGVVFHAPFLAIDKRFKFYGVWERTKNLAEQKYPGVKTFRSLDEMLADENIELVVVNTPNVTHYEYAKKALEAGRHIIVEKPFTATVEQAEELIELAKKKNKIISVYQNRRYDSDYRTIKKVLDEKLLGDLVEVEMHFDRYNEELSYKKHKEIAEKGTGTLYDLGSHLIDQALQLFGMPDAVFADIRIVRPISQVDDYFDLLLYYPSLRVRIKSSYQVREPLPGYILHGSKGSFIKPKTNIQEEALQAGKIPGAPDWGIEPEKERGLLHTEINGVVIKKYLESERGNYADYYDGIFDAIRNSRPVAVTGEDGLKVIKVIETAFKSSEEKKVIEIK
jgi:predicted dehydrogenase